MHADIDQLLSLRDGQPVDARIAAHVAECASCSGQLHLLGRVRGQLRELPQLDAPERAWQQIRAGLSRPQVRTNRWRYGGPALAALVATAAVVTGLRITGERSQIVRAAPPALEPSVERITAVPAAATQSLSALVDRSRQLEQLLHVLPERPAVERVSMAATIETLEQRIQWLDAQLSYAPDAADEQQARRLWGERVQLMDSLVKVRYAQAESVRF